MTGFFHSPYDVFKVTFFLYVTVYGHTIFCFVFSLVDICVVMNLGFFVVVVVVMTKAAINIHGESFYVVYIFIFLTCIPKSGTAVLYGNSRVNFLRNCQTLLQNDYCININLEVKLLGHMGTL